jgi:hypothetical protein
MYLLDANVFIEAHQRYYSAEFVPAFWDWLGRAFRLNVVASIDKIEEELSVKDDAVKSWARVHKEFFLPTDSLVEASLRAVSAWAMSGPYTSAARFKFLASADYRLIAFAHAHGHAVATHEQASPNRPSEVKIPEACRDLGVECVDPFTVIGKSGARFVLEWPIASCHEAVEDPVAGGSEDGVGVGA